MAGTLIPKASVPTQLVVNTGLSPAAVQLQIAAAIAAQAASDSATYSTKGQALVSALIFGS